LGKGTAVRFGDRIATVFAGDGACVWTDWDKLVHPEKRSTKNKRQKAVIVKKYFI
jgi:hypothetical protein